MAGKRPDGMDEPSVPERYAPSPFRHGRVRSASLRRLDSTALSVEMGTGVPQLLRVGKDTSTATAARSSDAAEGRRRGSARAGDATARQDEGVAADSPGVGCSSCAEWWLSQPRVGSASIRPAPASVPPWPGVARPSAEPGSQGRRGEPAARPLAKGACGGPRSWGPRHGAMGRPSPNHG